MIKKITIIQTKKIHRHSLTEELQWFANSLGLFGERDKDKSCFRVFLELLKSAKKNESLSSDEIAGKTHLSRGTVIHHINELSKRGIVITSGKKYILREDDLNSLLEKIKKDFEKIFEELKKSAEIIDKILE
jgi:predicted transcriptional regulator